MIALVSAAPPVSREELVKALTNGLARLFELPSGQDVVAAVGEGFPDLQHLSFDVSGARARTGLRVRWPGGKRHSGVTVAALHVIGRRVIVERAAVNFELDAGGVHFDVNHDQAEHFLDPVDAKHGNFQAHVGRADLETLLMTAAQDEVAKHGLVIEGVELELQDGDGRSVLAQVRVTASAKMGFASLRAVVRGRGQVVVDDAMNVVFKGLTFDGEGLAGKMAAGLAQRHLSEWDGWSFPLSSLQLGRLKIRDVRLGCKNGLQLEAVMGTAAFRLPWPALP